LIILGGGPAGLTASIYADRAGVDALTIEQGNFGGQVTTTDLVDNYPGIENVSGFDLAEKMRAHAEHLGAHFAYDIVEKIEKTDEGFHLTGMTDEYDCKTLIVATGATPRKAGFEGEEKFGGHGVSYCATCDGMFYRGKDAYVIGGGNTACEEADFLTRFANHVTMIVRKDHLRAQQKLIEKVEANPKITIEYNAAIVKVDGDELVETVTLRNTATGEEHEERHDEGSFGIFVFIGTDPISKLVEDLVELSPTKEIVTDERMATRTEGLFAAGDVSQKPLRQIITAAADGAVAATEAALYLGNMVI
jgi:thioredoxin reductase (NADPH)